MPCSDRYIELKSRVVELEKNLLPHFHSPTGDYTSRQLDKARGFRLLVHAEIESYLEDRVKGIVLKSAKDWKQNRQPSMVLVNLLSAYHSGWNVNDEVSNVEIVAMAKSRAKPKEKIEEVLRLAIKQFVDKVHDNHGIKDKNLKNLLFPVGVDFDDLESDWLAAIDSYGTMRGDIAHKTKRATLQINPKDEQKIVTDLVLGLEILDGILDEV